MPLWVWLMLTKYGLGFPYVSQFEVEARNRIEMIDKRVDFMYEDLLI